jgi:hypothetical protein
MPTRTADQLGSGLKKVLNLYRRGGFIVRVILMDMEFESLSDELELVQVNTTAAREHVGDIERGIRTIKDRARSTLAALPRKMVLPKKMIIHLIIFVIMWLNATPARNGISVDFSPREIVTQLKIDFSKHCRVSFGAYVEASEDADITNTMRPRTHACIALGPSGNLQGSVKCFDLETGMVVKRRTIVELPMPDEIIAKVSEWGEKSMKEQFHHKLEFLNRMKQKYDWDGDEAEIDEGLVEPDLVDPDLDSNTPGVLLAGEDELPVEQPIEQDEEIANAAQAAANANLTPVDTAEITGVILPVHLPTPPAVTDDESNADDDDDDIIEAGLVEPAPQYVQHLSSDDEFEPNAGDGEPPSLETVGDSDDEETDDEGEDGDDEQDEDEDEDEDRFYEDPARRYPRRKRVAKAPTEIDFDNKAYKIKQGIIHLNPAVFETEPPRILSRDDEKYEGMDAKNVTMHIIGVIMAEQYSINKGLKLFGKDGEKAVTKELSQMHDMVVYTPVHAHELTREQKHQALESLIFLTKKRCGRIKARACANGSKQRSYIAKENAISPTVATDSVFITSAIEAHERRHVMTMDIPGAFLHADTDEEIHMLLRGQLAELMVKIDPKLYRPFITKNGCGESIMFVKMQKAMYGMMRASLLFYLKLVDELIADGFELNPYDPCVANKLVNGKQMTVCWHVDDLKVSHVDSLELTRFVHRIAKIYGEQITVKRGQVHDYLGMDLDYSLEGKVRVSMIGYLDKVFKDFPEEIRKTSSSPAADHLFNVRDPEETEKQGKWLSEEHAQHFHHAVAQLLFLSVRARRDIQTAVSFLTTRVRKPDEDDWGKLKRVLQYLLGTRHMKLTLCVDNLGQIRWWVDASYNVHEDCKGQTGAVMSLGRGATISFSRKQKLNVRSSCEGELVGVDDAMAWILWCKYFIEAQGYTVEQNVLYQDNKSTILLATNGRWSSSKRTKHIKSRYFFVKDCVDRGELTVEHMPTDKMWADINTKPLQGKGFRVMRAQLMNVPEDYDDAVERRCTPTSLLPSGDSTAQLEQPISKNKASPGSKDCRSVLDGTVASEGAPANRSCKGPRVAPIMVGDGRTNSRKFKQLLERVRLAREYSRARRIAVE